MTKTLIKNGQLIDGLGGEPIEAGALVYEEDTLTFVGEESAYDADGSETVIDAQGGTILPGFIDTHVHLVSEFAPIQKKLETPFSYRFYQTQEYLKKSLQAGITSARDAGGLDLGIKKAVEDGLIAGPRLQISVTALTITGGHGDGYHHSGQTLQHRPSYPGSPNGKADGVEEVRKKTRELLRAGADIIKVHATGGVMSPTDHPEFTNYSLEELKVIVEEAHFRKGRKVMAHAQGVEGIKNAVEAGIYSIEHGIFLDDEVIEMMLEKGTYLVPTLLAPVAVREMFESSLGVPDSSAKKAEEVIEAHKESTQKAYEAGVKIAMGTDAGVMPHGTNLRELKLMTDIGMTPMESIVATTKVAAECLEWGDKVGTLEKGKLADVVITKNDPLKDIDGLSNNDNIQLVVKDGKIEKDLL